MVEQMAQSGLSKSVEIHIPVNFLTVDCGKCGGTDFKLKVLPQVIDGAHKAKLYAVQCSKCANVFDLDSNRFLEGKGESSFSPLIKPTGVG